MDFLNFFKTTGKRAVLLLIATLLMFSITVSATIAYIITKSETSDNIFTPPVLRISLDNVHDIANTGDIPVYVRAIAVANWASTTEEHVILSTKPVVGTDYVIEFKTTNWFQAGDGFYYYKLPLNPGEHVSMIKDAYIINEKKGYEIRLEIISSSIQAYPSEAIQQAWSAVYIDANGILQSAIAGEDTQ